MKTSAVKTSTGSERCTCGANFHFYADGTYTCPRFYREDDFCPGIEGKKQRADSHFTTTPYGRRESAGDKRFDVARASYRVRMAASAKAAS